MAATKREAAAMSTGEIAKLPYASKRTLFRVSLLLIAAVLAWAIISVFYACSVYMEATRPEPVDTAKFTQGQTRDSVRSDLGQPTLTTTERGYECDTYQLYTHALSAGGRAPIAILETAADVFTLGMAEAVLTPGEMLTKNAKYPVKFCYKDNKLVEVTEEPNPVSAQ